MCASPSAPLRRVDGLAKVKGTAVYGDDITLPGMLYGVCRFADIPAGKIEAIDLSEALNVAGVVKIATWQDIPGTPVVGIIVKDYLPIVKDEVVFHAMSSPWWRQPVMKPPVRRRIKYMCAIRPMSR